MSELKEQLDSLRNLLQDSAFLKLNAWAKKEKGVWSKLWGAFDNLEDTIRAIDEFLNEKNPSRLQIYGVLQALTIQQDAVKHLEQALGIEVTDLNAIATLEIVRNIRDETVGHPTNTVHNQEKSSYRDGTITYTSLHPESLSTNFEYIVWSSGGSEIKSVNLIDLIEQQKKALTQIITGAAKQLNGKETTHMQKFKHDSLEQLFNQSGYYIQKLWPFERSREYSKLCLDALKKDYRKFKNGIKARYGHTVFDQEAFLPGLLIEVQKVDKIFPKLNLMIMIDEGVDKLDLEVYVEALDNALKELRVMARETDEKFGYEPEE